MDKNTNRRKKVFFIDPMSMSNLARYDYCLMSAMNSDITYFCSKFLDIAEHSHIRYKRVFNYNHLANSTLKTISYALSYTKILMRILIDKPDIIHVQWLKIPETDLAFYKTVKTLSHAKLIFTAHNVLPHNTAKKYAAIYHNIYHLFDRIIVHSERTKREIVSKFKVEENHVEVIRHGIHKMSYDSQLYSSQLPYFDKKYGLADKFVITSLGEQSYYKGIDMLARVWAETPALRSDDSLRLVIAGKCKKIDLSCLQGITNATVVNDRIPDEEYYYLLTHSDLQLFPYRQISQSGALMIALAHHIPVLVTDQGALADPLKIGNVGWKIGSCTFDRLRDGILSILNDRAAARRIKADKEEWHKVAQAFDWHRISLQTQQLYDSL